MLKYEKSKTPNNDVDKNECKTKNSGDYTNDDGVVISDVTAKWTKLQITNSLQNVCLTAKRNRLVAIIGPVGAGKVCILNY